MSKRQILIEEKDQGYESAKRKAKSMLSKELGRNIIHSINTESTPPPKKIYAHFNNL